MASDNFDACLTHVLDHEAGYVDHPRDPGGATNMGVTRKTLARWRKVSPWWLLPKAEVKALGLKEAGAIYKALYWDRCAAGLLPSGLDLALFDFAVNSGPDRAVRTLQKLVGARCDGIVGPVTRTAIAAHAAARGPGALIEEICAARLRFLMALPIFPTFGKGWRRRVLRVRAEALRLAGNLENVSRKNGDPEMDILSGYKTYIVGLAMMLAALAQFAGAELPWLESQNAAQLLMEGFGIVFLRRGLKNDVRNA